MTSDNKEVPYSLYILECADHSLYTGISKDPDQRLKVHNAGRGAKYTRSHGPCRLLKAWEVGDKSQALRLEAAIKKLRHQAKLDLIARAPSSQELKVLFLTHERER
jgi:putative endonuclease